MLFPRQTSEFLYVAAITERVFVAARLANLFSLIDDICKLCVILPETLHHFDVDTWLQETYDIILSEVGILDIHCQVVADIVTSWVS